MTTTDTPQTPQPPSPPPIPVGSPLGTGSVTVERTVTTTNGQNAPQTPRTPGAGVAVAPSPSVSTVTSGASFADQIKPETVLQVHIGISKVEIDGETIIHDHLRNANYKLNTSGSFVWSHISPQATFRDLLASIREAHDVVPDATDRMVAEFLGELINRGVLTASTTGSAP